MEKYVPKDITNAPKQGFAAPDASWFKGDSIEFVRSRLLNKNAPIYNFLDYETTTGLVSQHLKGEENRRLLIWSLLNVNQWLDSI